MRAAGRAHCPGRPRRSASSAPRRWAGLRTPRELLGWRRGAGRPPGLLPGLLPCRRNSRPSRAKWPAYTAARAHLDLLQARQHASNPCDIYMASTSGLSSASQHPHPHFLPPLVSLQHQVTAPGGQSMQPARSPATRCNRAARAAPPYAPPRRPAPAASPLARAPDDAPGSDDSREPPDPDGSESVCDAPPALRSAAGAAPAACETACGPHGAHHAVRSAAAPVSKAEAWGAGASSLCLAAVLQDPASPPAARPGPVPALMRGVCRPARTAQCA